MTEIKDNEGNLLHIIFKKMDVKNGRIDICPTNQFLQCAALKLPKDTTFKPHQHIWGEFNDNRIPQESWIVIKGSVKVFLYDTKGTLIHTDIIESGEASFTFQGGHNYLIQEDDTIVFEYKTGPYLGQINDKIFI